MQCNKDLVALRCAPYWNTSAKNPLEENQDGAQQPNSIVLQHNNIGDGEGVVEAKSGNLGSHDMHLHLLNLTKALGFTAIFRGNTLLVLQM